MGCASSLHHGRVCNPKVFGSLQCSAGGPSSEEEGVCGLFSEEEGACGTTCCYSNRIVATSCAHAVYCITWQMMQYLRHVAFSFMREAKFLWRHDRGVPHRVPGFGMTKTPDD